MRKSLKKRTEESVDDSPVEVIVINEPEPVKSPGELVGMFGELTKLCPVGAALNETRVHQFTQKGADLYCVFCGQIGNMQSWKTLYEG